MGKIHTGLQTLLSNDSNKFKQFPRCKLSQRLLLHLISCCVAVIRLADINNRTYEWGSGGGANAGVADWVCEPGEEVGHGAFTAAVELQRKKHQHSFSVGSKDHRSLFKRWYFLNVKTLVSKATILYCMKILFSDSAARIVVSNVRQRLGLSKLLDIILIGLNGILPIATLHVVLWAATLPVIISCCYF